MTKILTGSTLSYGLVLPDPLKTADGSMFFLTASYTDPANSPTNQTAAPIARTPGLHVYSFQQDVNAAAQGDQVGQQWKQVSTLKTYVDKAGDTMFGDLIITSTGGVRVLNTTNASGGNFYANPGVAQGTTLTGDGGPINFQAGGSLRMSLLTTGVLQLTTSAGTGSVWTTINDGAGSGMDADLLDGQHGAYYLDTSNQTGIISVPRGGTGNSSTVQGGIVYGSSTTQLSTATAGTALQLLQSGGTGAPSWITPSSLIVGSSLTLKAGGVAGGTSMVFNWSGQSGQPTWLWGGNDGINMFVYNPSNFSVAQAANAALLNGRNYDEAPSGSTIVSRNSSGYAYATYFNSSAPLNDGTAMSNIIFTGTDGFLRKGSFAALSAAMGLNGSYVAKAGDNMTGNLTVNGITLGFASSQISTSGNVIAAGAITGGSFSTGGGVTAASVSASTVTTVVGGSGGITMQRGNASVTGYNEFVAANGVRQGYIGYSSTNSGTTDAGTLNFVMAQANFTGEVVAYASDARLKKNVTVIEDAMEKIATLGGYSYDWDLEKSRRLGFTPTNKHEHGLLAQEVQKVMPDAVTAAPFNSDYLTVKYERIVALLVAGMNEQQAQINALMSEVEELKNIK